MYNKCTLTKKFALLCKRFESISMGKKGLNNVFRSEIASENLVTHSRFPSMLKNK